MAILNDDIQDLAIEAGSIVLENGGETYRAEETVVNVAKSLGAQEAHAFVTPTIVLLSWKNNDGRHFMNMNRIMNRCTNLKKIALINQLSRNIEWLGRTESPENLRKKFRAIETTPEYSPLVLVLAASLCSFFFALMFRGTLTDALCAFFIGMILRIVLILIAKKSFNPFIVSLFSGLIIALLATIYSRFDSNLNVSITMISALMLVVPGVTIVNSIRDMIAGDLMAGSARFIEACIIAAGLSIGAVGGFLFVGLF